MEDIQFNDEVDNSHLLPPDVDIEDLDEELEDLQPVQPGPIIARQDADIETVGDEPSKSNDNNNNNSDTKEADMISLAPEPKPVEEVTIDGIPYNPVQEGLATILIPNSAKDQKVFYNPIQQFNRDLTVAVYKAFGNVCQGEHEKRKEKFEAKNARRKGGRKNKKGAKDNVAGEGEAAANGNAETPKEQEQQQQGENAEDKEGAGASNNNGGEEKEKPMRFRILDALSATGLRALRYAQELPFATEIVANDMSTNATASIDRNIAYNNVSDKVTSSTANAIAYMYHAAYPLVPEHNPPQLRKRRPQPNSNRFKVIDLDPFGTAVPFLDAAVQAVEDGGLLAVTCTDAGVFAATGYAEKCFSLYGGLPIKGDHCHEGGIRLILHAIGSSAAKYGACIEPLLSLSIDYYVRVFVRVRRRPESVKLWASSNMMVYSCDDGCGSWRVQRLGTAKEREDKKKNKDGKDPNPGASHVYKYGIARSEVGSSECEFCGTRMHVAGPMYSGPIHSKDFLERLLSAVVPELSPEVYGTVRRMTGMLQTALFELTPYPTTTTPSDPHHTPTTHDLEPPHFFILPTRLSKTLHCQAPSLPYLRSALLSLDHTAVRCHCRAGSIKTSAPWDVIWAIMRSWVKRHPIKEENVLRDSVAWRILKKWRKGQDEIATTTASSNLQETDLKQTEEEGEGGDKPADNKDEVVEEEELIRGIVWDENIGKEENYYGKGTHSKSEKILRYQTNPTPNWGPMARPDNPRKKNKQEKHQQQKNNNGGGGGAAGVAGTEGGAKLGMNRKERNRENRKKNKALKKALALNNAATGENGQKEASVNLEQDNGGGGSSRDIDAIQAGVMESSVKSASSSRKRKSPSPDAGQVRRSEDQTGGACSDGDEQQPSNDAMDVDVDEMDDSTPPKKQKIDAM